jgi:hypothetical protein
LLKKIHLAEKRDTKIQFCKNIQYCGAFI